MNSALLKAADLTPSGLLDLIEKLGPQPVACSRRVWLEAPDGWTFDWWPGLTHDLTWCGAGREPVRESARDCVSRSAAGRLFAADGELHWRVIPALGETCWRAVFIGTGDWVGDALQDNSRILADLRPRRDRHFLWGQQTRETPGEWIELRIPHRFRYPVAGNPRMVAAVVEQWCDDVGEPHFVRLCDLEPAQGTNDA